MKCPRCQHENEAGAKFCEECATPLVLACAKCGRQLSPAAKFCPECAQPTGLSAAQPPAPRFGSPESYTPRHLAEKILTSKAALEGERKQVTVLFADLKGSMELLADRDPEEAGKLLDPVLERMMEAVHRYEGTVNQVMGDGIMALFGAPVAHEDHGVRACYAALDMQAAIRRYADEVLRAHGIKPHIRVGLNSGEVVVRAIGSDLHLDYTAVGQTTHLAARMEQLATPGTVLLTVDTLRLAEGFIVVKPLGPVPIKGLEAPVDVYELTGAGPLRSRLHAAAARGLTRFVGRDAELDQFREALGRAASGHGQVVALVGEPGVGKSRLVWEVTHSHRTHGWLLLQAGAVSYGKATPYRPVIDLLKGYLQVGDRDEPRAIREKVTGKLLALDRVLEPALPAFLALLDVPVEDRRWEILDPPQRRLRTLDAVRRLLLRESQVQPLLVVVEDLHWIDAETQAVLDCLVESIPAARVLLLVNYRPEYRHDWGGKTYYGQLRLDPLAPENATALLESLLGGAAGLSPLKRLLLARTEGNPLFLEESVRNLVDDGGLAGERGAYRLAKAPETIQVPSTVQAMLAARIDRLPAEDKDLLQTAAVLGKDVPVAVLAAVAGRTVDALAEGLARLQAAEFLYEVTLFPDVAYTFKHALTHEVGYGSLLKERRRALHARAVAAIESLYPERLAEHIEHLAHHALRGETWEKAATYLRQAGEKATERSAYQQAAVCFEQALAVLGHIPESREQLEQAIDLHLDAFGALVSAGALAKVRDHLNEAEALTARLGDERRLGSVLVALGNHAWVSGDSDRALEVCRHALAIATRLGDVPLAMRANTFLGLRQQTTGEYREGVDFLRRAAEALQLHERFGGVFGGAGLLSVSARERLAWCLAELGEFEEAMAHGEEAVRIAREFDHPHSLAYGHRSLGLISLRRGDASSAILPLERAVEVCRVAQVRLPFDIAAGHLGYAYALVGRLPEGVSLMEEALADPAATGTTNHPLLLAYLGEAHLLARRREDALEVVRRALALAHRQKERGNEAWILRLLGEITEQSDPPDQESAPAYYRQALARADELGMRPLAAHCHLGLAKLYYRTDKRDQAQGHLATAVTMYREMGMRFWLEKAEAEMRSLV
jgi:class 3 adenylate cyclase/tetratricopeptide (TPR) repeat protein